LIDIYSRYGDLPELTVEDGFDAAKQSGILRMSRADLKPRKEVRSVDA
jgi:hypothetical protein